MSDDEREELPKFEDTEKKPKPIGVVFDYRTAGHYYLTMINKWIETNKPGYKPIYKSFDQYKQTNKLGDSKAYDKLKRAFEYFVKDKKPTKGSSPELTTYARKTVTRVSTPIRPSSPEPMVYQPPGFEQPPPNITYQPPAPTSLSMVNNDFSNNKMGEEGDKKMVLEGKSLIGKYCRDRSSGFKNAEFVEDWKNSMNKLYGITGKGFNISHNPDYLRKDYFDTVVKKKHPDWSFTRTEDLDGDKVPDIIIRDKENNVRYFNGYGLSGNKFSLAKQAYMADEATTDYDYKAFLDKYNESHPPKAKKNYADVVKALVKYLHNTIKTKIGATEKETKMLFKNSNLAGRVESLVNRFIVLPTMLLAKQYNPEEVKKTIFAAPDSNEEYVLHAIYRDKDLKEEWNKPANRTILAQAVSLAVVEIAKLINDNLGEFIDLMFYKHGDMTIGTACYEAMEKTLALGEGIKTINVNAIIRQLTSGK